MQTDVHSPANTRRFFPILLTRSAIRGSSQVFMLVRSITSAPGKAPLISSKIGPENVFSATVVRMVEALKPAAASATMAALLRRVTASIDLVAKAICDWWSIRISVWSCGDTRVLPGTGFAFVAMGLPPGWVVGTLGPAAVLHGGRRYSVS